MSMKLRKTAEKVARRGLHAVRRARDRPSVLDARARQLRERVATLNPDPGAARHVLLTSTGNRNIGDQAMLESFIANVGGPIDAIVLSNASYVLPESARDRVRLHKFDSLVYGRGDAQLNDLERFVELIQSARSFSVVGADVIDGGYQLRAPLMSWALATGAAEAGFDTRMLGFSWGENVAHVILEATRDAAAAGVRLYARDPDSAARLTRSHVLGVQSVVDTVFALEGTDKDTAEFRLLAEIRSSGNRIALLNVSGLIAGRMDVVDDYVEVAAALNERGVAVVALPHVNNRGGSDVAAIRELAARALVRGVRLKVLDRLLAPTQVRALAGLADVVVTGRMHLSILSLSAGTPAIVLATQGKVAGLMRRIGHPEWCVDPKPGMAQDIVAQLDRAQNIDRSELDALMPDLIATAHRNFEGLDTRNET